VKKESNMHQKGTSNPAVAVFGATGHTARFVIAELLRRNVRPIAIARNAAALAALNFADVQVLRRDATVDDAASLDRALHGAQAVINCAGPFVGTVEAVAGAALRAGIHYVDLCAEQEPAESALDNFDELARKAGVAVVPSMAFYGGFADLMVTAALGDWDATESIEIMIGLDSWHPTRGTRITIDRKAVGNMVITGGRRAPVPPSPSQKRWNFGEPLGDQVIVEVPFSEVVLISRHVKTDELHNYLSERAVSDVLDPATPTPKAVDAMGRSEQRFVVDVVIARGDQRRRATVRGRDTYAISATLACEAVERLMEGKFRSAGAAAPGAIFNAGEFLASLRPEHAVSEVITA
jgi:short subunit dehydrogenase-like uncharacterized protein